MYLQEIGEAEVAQRPEAEVTKVTKYGVRNLLNSRMWFLNGNGHQLPFLN